MPLVRTLEPEDERSPTWGLRYLFKDRIAREEDQVLAKSSCRAFSPYKVQQTIVAVGEDDRAFGRVGVDKVGPGASEGTSCFEGEEG